MTGENERRIIANQIKTPDGTVMRSRTVHDYQSYIDKNGKEYVVDGGNHYLRRAVHDDAPYEELSVFLDDPFEKVREVFEWGTYGKEGKGPFKRIALKDLEDSHIKAILETQKQIKDSYVEKLLLKELEYRDGLHSSSFDASGSWKAYF